MQVKHENKMPVASTGEQVVGQPLLRLVSTRPGIESEDKGGEEQQPWSGAGAGAIHKALLLLMEGLRGRED